MQIFKKYSCMPLQFRYTSTPTSPNHLPCQVGSPLPSIWGFINTNNGSDESKNGTNNWYTRRWLCINDCEWINSRCHGCSILALDTNSANSCYRFVFAKYSNIEIWCILHSWQVIPHRRKSISFIENTSPRIYILAVVCCGYTSLMFCIHLIYLWHFPWLLYRHRRNHMPIPVRSYDSARNLN